MYKYIAHEQIGYFGKDTAMVVDAPLSGHESAQAGVRFTQDGTLQLWSYATLVCEIHGDFVQCYFIETVTTRKHIGWFMKEYANSNYQIAKKSFELESWVNIKTGKPLIM